MKRGKKRAKKPRAGRVSISLSAEEMAELENWAGRRQLKRSEAVRILVTRGCRPARV